MSAIEMLCAQHVRICPPHIVSPPAGRLRSTNGCGSLLTAAGCVRLPTCSALTLRYGRKVVDEPRPVRRVNVYAQKRKPPAERFGRSLECQFDTRVGTACRQRVRPDQARLVRGFRFCETSRRWVRPLPPTADARRCASSGHVNVGAGVRKCRAHLRRSSSRVRGLVSTGTAHESPQALASNG